VPEDEVDLASEKCFFLQYRKCKCWK